MIVRENRMNQQKNFREKEQQKNKGSLTLEASIVLVFFLVAYMAILSVINVPWPGADSECGKPDSAGNCAIYISAEEGWIIRIWKAGIG